MRLKFAAVAALLLAFSGFASMQSRKTLDIYSIDVEGGQSTVFVSPSGESLLIDAGSAGERDAGRIVETAKQAGLTQIDYMLVTHYDGDHVGGVKDVSDRIPIKNFVDYGPRVQVPTVPEPTEQQTATIARFNETYAATIATGRHIVVKAGDALPIKGIDVQIVAAKGGAITKPLANGGARNPSARTTRAPARHDREHTRLEPSSAPSVDLLLDLGDLT